MRGLEAKKFSQSCTIRVILNNSKLDISTKLFPEGVIVFFLCNFLDHIKSFTNEFLSDHLEKAVIQSYSNMQLKDPSIQPHCKELDQDTQVFWLKSGLKTAMLGYQYFTFTLLTIFKTVKT